MVRHLPDDYLRPYPCLIVAVASALGHLPEGDVDFKEDGYATLREANKLIRSCLPVRRRVDYKRGSRPRLTDLTVDRAIVCVLGHYICIEGGIYYSFFDNDMDDVVAVWELK